MLARGSFNWLFTVDDLIMVVPYFWAFMLSQDNDVSECECECISNIYYYVNHISICVDDD